MGSLDEATLALRRTGVTMTFVLSAMGDFVWRDEWAKLALIALSELGNFEFLVPIH